MVNGYSVHQFGILYPWVYYDTCIRNSTCDKIEDLRATNRHYNYLF